MQLIIVPRVWISASAFTLFRIYPTFFAYVLFAQTPAAFLQLHYITAYIQLCCRHCLFTPPSLQ